MKPFAGYTSVGVCFAGLVSMGIALCVVDSVGARPLGGADKPSVVSSGRGPGVSSGSVAAADRVKSLGAEIVDGAREEARLGTPYVMNYEVIPYPGGDVTSGTGVCTDLVVRAFRRAGIDLQREVHLDRKVRPGAYPKIWDKNGIDSNIDHRRCPNLVVWFRKYARELTTDLNGAALKEWQPGDVVFYVQKGASQPWHVGIVSDQRDSATGIPMIIDSFPPRTSESHRLDAFAPVHSHFRMEKRPVGGR